MTTQYAIYHHSLLKFMMRAKRITSVSRCKCKYRVRCFYSKGAFLVLVWIMLCTITCSSVEHVLSTYRATLQDDDPIIPKWVNAIPAIFGSLGAVFSGWLADAKLGNYRVMKYSFVLLFFTSLCGSAYTLVSSIVHFNLYIESVFYCIGGSLFIVAVVAGLVTSLQLGLDQMPDASSSSITSFIAWFVFSVYTGNWISTFPFWAIKYCSNTATYVTQLYSLVPPFCMTGVLVSDFVFAQKLLIIEPKSPQLVKTIYQVLKFAAKHKAPLNRSAFTYWEEDVPSRMDLGKSRYGGPFTTEQVEDVKTILRLFPLCLTLWLLGGSLAIFHPQSFVTVAPTGWTTCTSRLLSLFTYNSMWCGIIWTFFYEFVVYPVIQNSLPSIIRRIGIISLVITTLSIVFLILELVYYYHSDLVAVSFVIDILHSVSRGLLTMPLCSTILELICAQAPYNMRGFFGGCMVFVLFSSYIIANYFPSNLNLTLYGVRAGLSIFGFMLYCLLARWYKRRVRDEDYNAQTVVEEVYDRYLSTQN